MCAADRGVLDRYRAQHRKERGKGTYLSSSQKVFFYFITRGAQLALVCFILLFHSLSKFYFSILLLHSVFFPYYLYWKQ